MTTPTPVPQPPVFDDEIDLFELAQDIWREKVLVVVVAGVVTLGALAYALLATPVYETSARLLPPLQQGIQPYNKSRVGFYDEALPVENFSVETVYGAFKTNLDSSRLQNRFFEEVYLPSLPAEKQAGTRDGLVKAFRQTLQVKKSDPKANPELYTVSVTHTDSVLAADWANRYIEMATTETKQQLAARIESERDLLVTALQAQIKSMLEIAKNERESQIRRIQEALFIAEATGLEDPSSQSDKASFGGNRFIDNDLIYTRGAKTLRAQLAVLQKRENDEAFIEDLAKTREQLGLLSSYQLSDANAQVVTIDQQAETPEIPVKPKKTMIVAVGIVLGGILGIFAALLRSAIRKRKESTAV